MARGRTSFKIKRVTKPMGETMKAIARTGICPITNAEKYFSLKKSTLDKMLKNNYIQSNSVITKNGVTEVFKLGSKGHKWIKENTNIEWNYRSNTRQLEHDLKLNQIYCQLSQEVRESWKNENEVVKNWENLTGKPQEERTGSVDAIIEVEEKLVAIEVVTNNYGEEELREKQETVRSLGCAKMIISRV